MNTSTKLLIILIISVPVTMFAFNWLLVEEYRAGHMAFDGGPQSPNLQEELKIKNFKHVVMDGRIRHKDGYASLYYPVLEVSVAPDQEIHLTAPEQSVRNVVTNIVNDTLYLSFYKENAVVKGYGFVPHDWFRLRLTAPEIESLTVRYGNFTISKFIGNSLNIQTDDAQVSVNNLVAKNIQATANGISEITFLPTAKIERLEYSITGEHGEISLYHDSAKSLKPGVVHPFGELVLRGNAPEMEKFITTINATPAKTPSIQ